MGPILLSGMSKLIVEAKDVSYDCFCIKGFIKDLLHLPCLTISHGHQNSVPLGLVLS